jgi:diacylglycerol kinase (ATP)
MAIQRETPPLPQQPVHAAHPAALIVSTGARHGQEWFDNGRKLLAQSGITIKSAAKVEKGSLLRETIEQAVESGSKLIIVGGGDGSLRTAASVLAHTDVTLGILPLGTVNDFARNLDIQPDLVSACRIIAEGRIALIDIGMANDDYFVITASFGVSALAQTVLTPRMKKLLGPFSYPVASLLIWRRLRHLHVTLEHDGKTERMTVMQAGVINGHSWMGGRCEIPGIGLESGRLAFYAVPPQSNFAYLRIARHVCQGRFFETPGLIAFTTREISIQTKRRYPLVLDGDLRGETPVRLRVVPDALRVCVGPAFRKSPAAG